MARISLLFRSKQSYDSCIWQVRGRRIQRWHSRALRCKLRGPNPRLRPSLPSVCPLFEIGLHAWCRFKKNKIMKAGNHTIQSLTPPSPHGAIARVWRRWAGRTHVVCAVLLFACMEAASYSIGPSHIYSNSDAAQPQTPLECDHRAPAFKFSAPAFGYNYWRLVVCVPLA